MPQTFSWKDMDDIAIELAERHSDRDPFTVRFTELRSLVEALPDFEAQPDEHVNEQILEAIQKLWSEELQEIERDEDEPAYSPPSAYKPDA